MKSKYRVVKYWHVGQRAWVYRVERRLEGATSYQFLSTGIVDLEMALVKVRAYKDDELKESQTEVVWEDE